MLRHSKAAARRADVSGISLDPPVDPLAFLDSEKYALLIEGADDDDFRGNGQSR